MLKENGEEGDRLEWEVSGREADIRYNYKLSTKDQSVCELEVGISSAEPDFWRTVPARVPGSVLVFAHASTKAEY